jgi:hypothetical protein
MASGDSIVDSVIQKFLQRSALGKEKYGVTLDRTDLSVKDWIQHAQDELMDGILYLEKLKKETAPPEKTQGQTAHSQEERNHSSK